MTRSIWASVLVALSLAGCETVDEAEIRQCRQAADVPAWNLCIEEHNARFSARQAREAQETSDDDAAATTLLLGGTAFLNGYNQARPPAPIFTTCTQHGCISQ